MTRDEFISKNEKRLKSLNKDMKLLKTARYDDKIVNDFISNMRVIFHRMNDDDRSTYCKKVSEMLSINIRGKKMTEKQRKELDKLFKSKYKKSAEQKKQIKKIIEKHEGNVLGQHMFHL